MTTLARQGTTQTLLRSTAALLALTMSGYLVVAAVYGWGTASALPLWAPLLVFVLVVPLYAFRKPILAMVTRPEKVTRPELPDLESELNATKEKFPSRDAIRSKGAKKRKELLQKRIEQNNKDLAWFKRKKTKMEKELTKEIRRNKGRKVKSLRVSIIRMAEESIDILEDDNNKCETELEKLKRVSDKPTLSELVAAIKQQKQLEEEKLSRLKEKYELVRKSGEYRYVDGSLRDIGNEISKTEIAIDMIDDRLGEIKSLLSKTTL
jgi:hypothetical protein